ncbi:S-layer homology domain-containing protein [Paenibacillus frigoriresistens]|uniref:S-layer homology domain-containing protein n=1 Tax=Paenibacillus alginolyticus TaxID=59839 RepID=UPI0015646FC0|nr:S-layer homology domain-containing protein [Paenibacillus frigoriresistens]NRF95961.1 S-layer homology domain-containing protein [Paenibacillus frigoriresistens]
MKNFKQTLSIGICAVCCFVSLTGVATFANESSFSDVSRDYWAYSNIQWAMNHNVINGYPDGTFKPNQVVSQSEWFAMLIRAFQPSDFKNDSKSSGWDASYQDYAAKIGLTSIVSDKSRLTRGNIAEYLTEASGKHYNTDDSIQYILDIGLSEGKSSKSVSGFKKNDFVTRSEAITFIEGFNQKFSQLSTSPSGVETYKGAEDSSIYENTKYNFTLKLPDNWKDKYEIKEQNNADAHIDNVVFISKANKTSGGVLFMISIWSKADWDVQGDDIMKNTHTIKLAERGDKVFTITTPSDVETDSSNPSAKSEYNNMFNSIKDIQSTFTLQ